MSFLLQRMVLAFGALAVLLLAGCSTVMTIPPSAKVEPAAALAAWSDVLKHFVRTGNNQFS